jgi:molybdate transport system regulatory protein
VKISARNQLTGRVAGITPGPVNSVVEVTLAGGQTVTAVITEGSVKSLGLHPGTEVFVLVKASNVMLMTDDSGMRLSARNTLPGTVKSITRGPVSTAVTLTLNGGGEIHSTITTVSADALGLAEGMAATAVIKAPNVILGVPA